MVVADTDVIIAAIRGNEIAKQLLLKYLPNVTISVITEMELNIGATNKAKQNVVEQVLKTHQVLPLSKAIGERALKLVKTYNTTSKSLFMADALIAATCLHHGASLLTFNTNDFKFIKGLHLDK